MLDEEFRRFISYDKIIDLTEREVAFLSCLIQHKHRITTIEELADYIFERKPKNIKSSVRQIVGRLRPKLKGEVMIIKGAIPRLQNRIYRRSKC